MPDQETCRRENDGDDDRAKTILNFFLLVQSVAGNKKVLSEVVSIYISLSHLLPILSLSSTN